MLLDSLGRHPELYAFPKESRLIPYLAASQKRHQDLSDDRTFRALWESVLSLSAFEQANGNCKLTLPADWQDCPRDLGSVLNKIFCQFAALEGKLRWCEKTPQYAQHIELLGQLFPHAKFVHVIRDGRDCAASFNRRWLRSPVLTMYRWKSLVSECRRQAALLPPDQYMEVSYENLTAEPEVWLRRICIFLKVPFSTVILQSSRPYFRPSGEIDAADTVPALQINSGHWQRYFSPEIQRQLELIGGRALHECGYATLFPESDHNPSQLEKRILSARDALAQFSREIGLKLQGKIERPWRVILGKPFVAYKHRTQNKF